MKKLLNTLFVTTQGTYLAKDGETVLVRIEKENRLRVPIHTLGGIVCFGQVSANPALMGLCGKRDVLLSFLTENGRFLARVQGPVSGNVKLRREQYRRADDAVTAAMLASTIVTAKIVNSRNVLARALRDRSEIGDVEGLSETIRHHGHLLQETRKHSAGVDTVRGWEGEAARSYFAIFDQLITKQKAAFHFKNRTRRPPLDIVNALLSFVYTLIAHDVTSALESVGLDPQVGFLHCDRPGRPGLALDLMEELRAYLGDRLALSRSNRYVGAGDLRCKDGLTGR